MFGLQVLAPSALRAQGTAATASGFVQDESGAKIPGATVTYTNTASGVAGTATTNGGGLYRVSGLVPGGDKATVARDGFKTSVTQGMDLQIEEQITLNYTLTVSAMTKSVTVTAANNVLESSFRPSAR